jgi:hypothetical protein
MTSCFCFLRSPEYVFFWRSQNIFFHRGFWIAMQYFAYLWSSQSVFAFRSCTISTRRPKRDSTTRFFASDFSGMVSSQAPCLVSENFSYLIFEFEEIYLRFLIDSPLSCIAESQYTPSFLLQRIATPLLVCSGELCTNVWIMCRNLGCCLLCRVENLCIV